MRTTARFMLVSQGQFESKCARDDSKLCYDNLCLPRRATAGSAGYDFFAPYDIVLQPKQTVTVTTGIRIVMPYNWALLIYPRSSLGFRHKLRLDNTVGVIDSDYAYSDNEGHIIIKITNEGDSIVNIPSGSAFAQGILTAYMTTEDDDVKGVRNGGIGSTDVSEV